MKTVLNSAARIMHWNIALLAVLLVGCSVTTEPVADASRPGATLAATSYTSGTLSTGSHTNLLSEGTEDEFSGPVAVAGVTVRLKDDYGTLANGVTGEWGQFSLSTSTDAKKIQFVLPDGAVYTVKMWTFSGSPTAIRAKLDTKNSKLILNAEMFPDADGDGVSDTGKVKRVRDRVASYPESGTETIEAEDGV